MNDEMNEHAPEVVPPVVLPAVGEQLRGAREGRQLTVADVAQALKLGPRQVEALENGDWAGLPGHTFVRGFVRNYARLVALDPLPMMAQLDAILETEKPRLNLPETAPATMPSSGRSQQRDYAVALFGVLLVVFAVGIYFFMPGDLASLRESLQSTLTIFSRKEAPAAPAVAPAAAPTPAEPVFPPGATPQQVMNPQAEVPPGAGAPTAQPAASALAPPPLQSSVAAAPADGAEAPLRFTLDKESWIEVRDRDGKIVFSQRCAPGTEQRVGGQGPFALVIGNAAGVRLAVRGQAFDLGPHIRGEVARLTVE